VGGIEKQILEKVRPVNLVVVIVGLASIWEVLWKFLLQYYGTLQFMLDWHKAPVLTVFC